MECCSLRKERNTAAARGDVCSFANACVVDGLCDECAFTAIDDAVEMCGRDPDLGSQRTACLEILTTCRRDLLTFEFVSPNNPDEGTFDLYLGWALESKCPHVLDWLLEHRPKHRTTSNREMVEIIVDLDFVSKDADRARWDTYACLDVLAKYMHVPMSTKILQEAASQGHEEFFRWVMDNKHENMWKRKEYTEAAFTMGHLDLVRTLACKAGVPFYPHEMKTENVVQAPSETRREYRKRKLFVNIMQRFVNNYFS